MSSAHAPTRSPGLTTMSMLEGLASTLAEMSFVQLALVFLAVGAYSMAINGAFGGGARSGAASASVVAAVAFAALTPSWISGVVVLAEEAPAPFRLPVPQSLRAFAASVIRSPL